MYLKVLNDETSLVEELEVDEIKHLPSTWVNGKSVKECWIYVLSNGYRILSKNKLSSGADCSRAAWDAFG